MAEIIVTPLVGKTFGATITGVDLRTLTAEQFATIRTAFLDHGLLFWAPGKTRRGRTPTQHPNEQHRRRSQRGSRTGTLRGPRT